MSKPSQVALVAPLVAALALLGACADAAAGDAGPVEDLGVLAAKADGVTLREATLVLGPGEIKRYRVVTTGLRASLEQAGSQPVQLSAKSFEIDVYGDVSAAPTVEAVSPDAPRTWTIRVHNQGTGALEATVHVLEWDPADDAPPYVGELGPELRREAVSVPAGDTKTFRIATTRFYAELTQTSATEVQLSAKHYEIDLYGEPSLTPWVNALSDVDVNRNWTLRVANVGDEPLDGEVVVYALQAPEPELGLISDIDKTLLPPELPDGTLPAPYPGVVTLFRELELGGGGQPGDMFFVTARSDDRIEGVPAWMALYDVPAGPISTGISGIPWIAQSEKVRDLSAILTARPDQRFVLFGDASHRDPEAYNEVIAAFPGRIVAGFIHEVKPLTPERLGPLHAFTHYGEVAATLFGLGVLDEPAARAILTAARDEGVSLTDAEVEALLDAQRVPLD